MTRLRASIILAAFAFGLLAGPLFASTATCRMSCCKHAKTASVTSPVCPLPQQCPEVSRDAESSNRDDVAPAPAQPVVHAVPAIVAVVVSAPPLRRVATDRVPIKTSSERPLYLLDSIFLI